MSIGWSMTTSLSGLNAFSRAIGHISDNISNSQTLGYKRVDTDFRSFLTTSTPRRHDPGGVVATPNFQHAQSGQITISQYDTAFAIDGQGFIPVKVPFERAGQLVFTDAEVPISYTRAGDFQMDRRGYLVNSSGHYLMAQNVMDGAAGGTLTAAQFDQVLHGASAAQGTTRIDYNANLPAGATTTQPSSTQFYDPQGTLQTLSMAWTRQTAPPANNSWNLMFDAKRQVDQIQLNSSGLAPGETLSFAIGDDRVTVTAPSGGYTAAEARNALMAAINGNAGLSEIVTATRGGQGNELVVTSNVAGQTFLSQVSGNANPQVETVQPGIPVMELGLPQNDIGAATPQAAAGQTTRFGIPDEGLSPGNYFIFRVNGESFTVRNDNPVLEEPPGMMTATQVRDALVQQIEDNSATVSVTAVGTQSFQITANSGAFTQAPQFLTSGPAPAIGFRPDDNSAPATAQLDSEGFRPQITDIQVPAGGLAAGESYSVVLTRPGQPAQTFSIPEPGDPPLAAPMSQAAVTSAIRTQINGSADFTATNMGGGRIRITSVDSGVENSFTTSVNGTTTAPLQQAQDQLKFVVDGPLTPGNALRVTLTQGGQDYIYTVENTNAPGGANLSRAQVLADLRNQILATEGADFTAVVGDGELRVRSTASFSGSSVATVGETVAPGPVQPSERIGTIPQTSTLTLNDLQTATRANAQITMQPVAAGQDVELDIDGTVVAIGPAPPGGGWTADEAKDEMLAALGGTPALAGFTFLDSGPGVLTIRNQTYGTGGDFTVTAGGTAPLPGIVDTPAQNADTVQFTVTFDVDGTDITRTFTYTAPNNDAGTQTAAAAAGAFETLVEAEIQALVAAGEPAPFSVAQDGANLLVEATRNGSAGRLEIGTGGTAPPVLADWNTSITANPANAGQTVEIVINGEVFTHTPAANETDIEVADALRVLINAGNGVADGDYTVDGPGSADLVFTYADLGQTGNFTALVGGDAPPNQPQNVPDHPIDEQADVITFSRSAIASGETVSITVRDDRLPAGVPGALETFTVEVPNDIPPWWEPAQIAEAMVIEINSAYPDGRIEAFVDETGAIALRATNTDPVGSAFTVTNLTSSLGADFAPVHGAQRAATTGVPVEAEISLDIDTELAVGRSVTVRLADPSHPLFPEPPTNEPGAFFDITITNDDDEPWSPEEVRERLIEAFNDNDDAAAIATASAGTQPGTIRLIGTEGGIDGGLFVMEVMSDQEIGEGDPPAPAPQDTEVDFRAAGFPQDIQAGDTYTVTIRVGGQDYVYRYTAEEGDTPASRTQALAEAITTGAAVPGVTVEPAGAPGVNAQPDPTDPSRLLLTGDPDGERFEVAVRGTMVQQRETVVANDARTYTLQTNDIDVGQSLTFTFAGETITITGSDANPQIRTAAQVSAALMEAINAHPVLGEEFTALPGERGGEIMLAQADRTAGMPVLAAFEGGQEIPIGQLANLELQGLPIVDVQPDTQVVFGPDGRLEAPATGQFTITLDWSQIDPARGVQTIVFDIGQGGANPSGTTQYAGDEIRIRSIDGDGRGAGEFERVSVNDDGFVIFHYTNGENRRAYEIPVATFANPDALRRLSGSLFAESVESGAAMLRAAGEQGAGSVIAGAVEQSNVDIAEEFTKMIIAQRSYSANARSFTTSDEMLQEALQLKR